MSRLGEDLREQRRQQKRDCETLEWAACATGQQRLKREQGLLWELLSILLLTLSTTSHTQDHLSTILAFSQDVCLHICRTQVPDPASSLLFLGHHHCLAQPRSEVVHKQSFPPAGQCKPLLSMRGQSQQGVAVTSSSLNISLKPHYWHQFQKGKAKESNTNPSFGGNLSKVSEWRQRQTGASHHKRRLEGFVVTRSQKNTHRRFGLNIFLVDEMISRRSSQDIAATRREGPAGTAPCSCQARDIDRITVLIPIDGGEQHLQRHTLQH